MYAMNSQEINELLPYLLQKDNGARYEAGKVFIGDRRAFPFEKTFVECQNVEEVAIAIEEMVTQGGGPWIAASYAMAMAAREVDGEPEQSVMAHLAKSKARLVDTRPTNTALALILDVLLSAGEKALSEGRSAEEAILKALEDRREAGYQDYLKRASHAAGLMEDGDGILTMCFAETSFLLALALAKRDGKKVVVYTPETRPYLQGARLTAPSVHELGIPVKIIGDSMPAYLMSVGKIQKYFTAADLITLDGHVVNKIGTFQIAIAANYHEIPYFAFMWGVDPGRPDRASITIEERDPAEMRLCCGVPTTLDEIEAYYPAFDITPPHMVSGIITHKGVFRPEDLKRHIL
jgi:methylthioribose-1-phosphate isomerase